MLNNYQLNVYYKKFLLLNFNSIFGWIYSYNQQNLQLLNSVSALTYVKIYNDAIKRPYKIIL